MDFLAAFDWLVMDWVSLVLEKKGVMNTTINRIKSLYFNNIVICVLNNIMGRSFMYARMPLWQGDVASKLWVAYIIYPFLSYMAKRLSPTIFMINYAELQNIMILAAP